MAQAEWEPEEAVIRRLEVPTKRLLLEAGALGRLPTPVDDIVAASRLSEPGESLLSDSALARAPQYLRFAVQAFRHKVRAVLDRRAREIHLDPDLGIEGKRSFARLHEVVHDLVPWQSDLVQIDGDQQLSLEANALFEREANVGAAQLLFQQDLLGRVAGQYDVGIRTITDVAGVFGGTVRATAREYARSHRRQVMTIVLDLSPLSLDPLRVQRREMTRSAAWIEVFGPTLLPAILDQRTTPWLADAVATGRGATRAGRTDLRSADREARVVEYEFLNTSYQLVGVFSLKG
jgi:hypothetical protein